MLKRQIGWLGALMACGMGLLCRTGWSQIHLNNAETVDIRRDPTVAAVEQVMPCVVNIATKNIVRARDPYNEWVQSFFDPYYRQKSPESPFSLGSGVVIDEDGYLLTNEHVVRIADKIAVKFASSGQVYDATVVAIDAKTDVALLKINGQPGEKFQAIKLAHEDDLLLGETVLALGNPFGLGGSVSRGILSSKSRRAAKEGEPLVIQDCLQTDAAINPGSSGGPLVNLRGELIGLNDQYVPEAQSIGFAIPIKLVLSSLSEIYPGEFLKSFWFGARVKAGSLPLTVSAVHPESPADRAGLKVGDAILALNGKSPRSFVDFADALAKNANQEEKLFVQRGLQRMDLTMRLLPEKDVFNAELVRNKLGLDLERVAEGFIIKDVQTNSPGSAVGLQSGMLVKQIDEQAPVADVTALAKFLYGKKKGEVVRLDVAAWQRSGSFNVLRQGSVELTPR